MISQRTFDAVIGANVKRYRQAAGLSQTDLADLMTEAGYSFQQQTVLKVEKGSRPLRGAEVAVLALLLRVDVTDLLMAPGPVAAAYAEVLVCQRRVTALDAQLEDVKRQRDNAQLELSKAVGSHERTLKTRKDAGDDLERLLFPGRD